jgi:pantetheine-phosphate adenylyltransferase
MTVQKKRIGIYPGTFDPVTKGHLQLIKRASKLVDVLIVAVAVNERKKPLFTLEERVELIETDIKNMPEKFCEIEVRPFDSLLVQFAEETGADCIIRGLRAVSDFEYEFQMTGMNARLAPDLETVFLMASDKYQFVSSAFVKEIFSMGGDISEVVTPNVAAALKEKFH